MLGIVLEAPYQLTLGEMVEPGPPGPGEALVRVLRVGVCGTDLHAFCGRQPLMTYPVVLGHELAVEVLDLGADDHNASVRVGDVCTVIPYFGDGCCDACRRGTPNACETLSVLGVHVDGGMREAFILPARLLIPANDLPVESVALVEMLAIGAHAARRASLLQDDRVLVIGAGPIGLSTLALARLQARKVAVLELESRRLTLVRDLGLALAIDAGSGSQQDNHLDTDTERLVERVRAAFGGVLPNVVFDATGNVQSMQSSVELVASGGRLVFIGHTKEVLRLPNPVLHTRELSLLFSRNATYADFDTVLQALRQGEVDPRPWITTRVGPEALVQELGHWVRPGSGVVKAILEMQLPAPATTVVGHNGEAV